LVEVSPDAKPPVCKILDYGKLKYREQKSKKEAKKKQKTIEIKEIKIRPGINKHDYEVKVKAFHKFIKGGNKVKVSMRFRGREMEHQNLGLDLLKRLIEQVKEYAKVEVPPKNEGKQIMMVLVPFNEK
jgi:translation initiation factor IF-3